LQLVIDQVMKNANCHDEKMEVCCNVVRALEDKFYGIELNHVPRKYNEEADELAKIASGRITVPPNIFTRDVAKPFVDLGKISLSQGKLSGAPSNPAGAEPMDEDSSYEAFVLSLLRGMGHTRPRPWTSSAPLPLGGLAKQVPCPDRSEGANLRSDQGKAHHQKGKIVHRGQW
jgi:hypothetical protein